MLTNDQQNLSRQVKFCQIASVFRDIEQTASRNEKIAIFNKMFHEIGHKRKQLERFQVDRRRMRQSFG